LVKGLQYYSFHSRLRRSIRKIFLNVFLWRKCRVYWYFSGIILIKFRWEITVLFFWFAASPLYPKLFLNVLLWRKCRVSWYFPGIILLKFRWEITVLFFPFATSSLYPKNIPKCILVEKMPSFLMFHLDYSNKIWLKDYSIILLVRDFVALSEKYS
jgi:hypothetical protein